REEVHSRFSADALRGAVFVDPGAEAPYFFHLALLRIIRKADPNYEAFGAEEPIEFRLVGLRQDGAGRIEECPVEHLLLLRGGRGGIPLAARPFAAHAAAAIELAVRVAHEQIAAPLAERHRAAMLASLP